MTDAKSDAATTNYTAIRYEQADGVATITLNRPDVHNAMNQAMRRELLEVFTRLRTDDTVRAVVVTGGGDKGAEPPLVTTGETQALLGDPGLFDGIPQDGLVLGSPAAPVTMIE